MSKIEIVTTCPSCNKENEPFEVDEDALIRWQEGELIQNTFPELTTSQREQLITGMCDKCWDDTIPPEEDF